MKILVTSSTGLTGKYVVRALHTRDIEVRAMVHSARRSKEMLAVGASEIVIGDITSINDLTSSMEGIDAVYHICPTARKDEVEIGKLAISAAKNAGVNRFIYQSVLHSIEHALPHHCQKLEVERTLIDSGLCYSIVQPAPFMQNILSGKNELINNKEFVQKFFRSIDSNNHINLIDAYDFAECVASMITEKQFEFSTLELCGPQNLSAIEMVDAVENVIGEKVEIKYISDDDFRISMEARCASQYSIDTLLRMFRHYNEGNFCGSDFVTSSILKRRLNTFADFLKRELL